MSYTKKQPRKCIACGTVRRKDGSCHSPRCLRADEAELQFHLAVSQADDGDLDAMAIVDKHIAAAKVELRRMWGKRVRHPNRERHKEAT